MGPNPTPNNSLRPFGKWGIIHFPMQDHFCKIINTHRKEDALVPLYVIVTFYFYFRVVCMVLGIENTTDMSNGTHNWE